MLRLLVVVSLSMLLSACGGGFFKIPKEEYRLSLIHISEPTRPY